jgi:hypothetical protein
MVNVILRQSLSAVLLNAALETSDGRLWFSTAEGVWEFTPGGAPGEIQGFRKYGPANGLSD